MLYRFKSQATGDLVMLEADGKHLLQIWGKDPSGPGVLLCADMDAAAAALLRSADEEEQAIQAAKEQAKAAGEPPPDLPPVAWRARIQPMLQTIKYCQAEDAPLRWEV